MPTFDVVSQLDLQEVRNAVDQTQREIATRFDFKGTGSTIELDTTAKTIMLRANSEGRAEALLQVLEEKLVRRKVSTKAVTPGRLEEAAGGTVRQVLTLNAGISDEKARHIAKHLRDLKLKGVQVQIQGDQLRVQSKQKDDLQVVIRELREHDFGIPLQFVNRRD